VLQSILAPRLVAAGYPVGSALRAIAFDVRDMALQRERIAGQQMLFVVADDEPTIPRSLIVRAEDVIQ
jgi:hypothetical protein